MKTLSITFLVLSLMALTWLSLGWMALLVVPSLALFVLMTFTPLLTTWAQEDELRYSQALVRKHTPTRQTGSPLHRAGRSVAH